MSRGGGEKINDAIWLGKTGDGILLCARKRRYERGEDIVSRCMLLRDDE